MSDEYNIRETVAHEWVTEGGIEYYVTSHGEIYQKGDIPTEDELIADASVGAELLYWYREAQG